MGGQGIAAAFVRDERGAEVVEYAVMVALVVGGTIAALGTLLIVLLARNQDLIQVILGS